MDIRIDPGQAFGTGAHATTGMCLELLLELADAGEAEGALADLGTGSGVLAIAAAKLGWSPVIGCDSEPAAIEAAAANAAANGVELELERLNLREQEPPRGADDRRQPDRAAARDGRRAARRSRRGRWSARACSRSEIERVARGARRRRASRSPSSARAATGRRCCCRPRVIPAARRG